MCPSCFKNKAQHHFKLGLLPCKSCQIRQANLPRPQKQIEFTSDSIKLQRLENADSIEQPHYKGSLNKRWVELYGEQAALNHGFSKQEIKNAKYVYNGITTYYNR